MKDQDGNLGAVGGSAFLGAGSGKIFMLTRNHPRLSLYMFKFFIGSLSEQAMVDYDIYTLIPSSSIG